MFKELGDWMFNSVLFWLVLLFFSPFGGLLYRLQSGAILRLSMVFSGGEVERLDM